MTPGRGKDHSRLRDAEARVQAHLERLRPLDSRTAAPFAPRFAIHRAIATEQITHATRAEVKIVYWNGTAYVDSGKRVDVGGFLLNTDETIEINQAIFIIHLTDNSWEVLTGNCKVKDWMLYGEEE